MSAARQVRQRVVMILWTYPPEFSGAARQAQTLARRLAQSGVSVTVVCSRAEIGDTSEDDAGVQVVRLGTGATADRRLKRFGRRALAWLVGHRREWDIVHVHSIGAATYAAVAAARFLGKKSVLKFTLIGDDDPATIRSTRFGATKLRLLARFDRYIAISSALRDALYVSSLDNGKVRQIPNAVDPARFTPLASDERTRVHADITSELGWPTEARLAVFIGGIEHRKGVDVLVDAWPKVIARVPEARLLLIGPLDHETADPEYRPRLEATLREASVAATVRFLGRHDAPERFLRVAEVFAFPSRAEGMPSAVAEAQMAGVPCVMAELPGITEDVMSPGKTGIVVPQNDPNAFSETLCSVLEQPDRAREMGRQAHGWALERFGLDAVAAQYRALYEELCPTENRRTP